MSSPATPSLSTLSTKASAHAVRLRPARPVLLAAITLASALTMSVIGAPTSHAAEVVRVEARVLVVTDDGAPVEAIRTQLQRQGVPVTTVRLDDAGRTRLTAETPATNQDGVRLGHFQGVVLPGNAPAGLGADELTALADYERELGVRQIDAYNWANPAQVIEVDGVDVDAATVGRLKANAARVLCYVSAGSWEDWRPDASAYPRVVLGANLDGWPGERWVDVRRIDLLRPLLAARVDVCQRKGFDGVDFDNVDGYTNSPGFPLTGRDQLRFNKMLSTIAHNKGLAVALKNDLEHVPALVGYCDLAVNESCTEWDECSLLSPFVAAGKPVLHIEYDTALADFCP